MQSWPKYPLIYEINTWVWLRELGQKYQRPITLASVPSEEWDALAMPFSEVDEGMSPLPSGPPQRTCGVQRSGTVGIRVPPAKTKDVVPLLVFSHNVNETVDAGKTLVQS